jgi:hypothetical protein
VKTKRHKWTEGDDLVALYLWRHGTRFLPLMEGGIAKLLGMPEGSLARGRANFAHLDGKGGLDHVAKQSRRIHQRHKRATEVELRPLVLQVISRTRAGRDT